MRSRLIFIASIIGAIAILISIGYFWRVSVEQAERSRAAITTAQARRARPPVKGISGRARPRVVIVMDDFGYNMNNVSKVLAMKEPVTLSILPGLPYSSRIAQGARSSGREVILHLPLEPKRGDVQQETDTIKGVMSEEDVGSRLEKDISSVPGLKGVSNHMGSKATEDKRLMLIVMKHLRKRNLYFFDSLTSNKSVCRSVAAQAGVPYARRDVFLDNEDKPEYIERQIGNLKRMAKRRGLAIAVCHDRANTVDALARAAPGMASEGLDFVSLSEVVK